MQHSKQIIAPLLIVILTFIQIPSTLAAVGDVEVSWYLHDHLGGIEKVLNEDFEVVADRDYLPHGMTLEEAQEEFPEVYGSVNSPEPGEPNEPQQSITEPYAYTGKELDNETQLYYYGARYYDPVIGSFTSQDPVFGSLADPQSLNKYSYVGNNPLIFIDPTGMYKIETGEVEKGDTLNGITGELNDFFGTSYHYNQIAELNGIGNPDLIHVGDTVRTGVFLNNGGTWQFPTDSDQIVAEFDGWNEDQVRIGNLSRNFFQTDLPPNLGDMASGEWQRIGPTATHNLAGASGHTDYRGIGSRSNQQAIYGSDGNLVTSPENMGTFDFIAPAPSLSAMYGHYKADVEPWINYGNSVNDTTTRGERKAAAIKSIFYGLIDSFR